uniref:PHD-type domain-containing protein n=1 Tax=Anopheles atroparvus TaxID=41427 RepID=A0A182J641_ANOAO
MANVCFACANDLSPDTDASRCVVCEAWFHDACTKIPCSILAGIKQYANMHSLVKSSTAHFSCTGSNVAASHADRTSPVAQSHRQFTYADTLRRTPAPEHVVITGTNAASPNLIATQDRTIDACGTIHPAALQLLPEVAHHPALEMCLSVDSPSTVRASHPLPPGRPRDLNFRKLDCAKLSHLILEHDWSFLDTDVTIDEATANFTSVV